MHSSRLAQLCGCLVLLSDVEHRLVEEEEEALGKLRAHHSRVRLLRERFDVLSDLLLCEGGVKGVGDIELEGVGCFGKVLLN